MHGLHWPADRQARRAAHNRLRTLELEVADDAVGLKVGDQETRSAVCMCVVSVAGADVDTERRVSTYRP